MPSRALSKLLLRLSEDPEFEVFPRYELPDLTPRERDVLSLLARGFSQRQMAEHLGLRRDTVKDYLMSGYGKLGVRDRVGAVRALAEYGLLED